MNAFPDTFQSGELIEISELMSQLHEFNKQQMDSEIEGPLFAEVVLYRRGKEVARITEASGSEVVPDSLAFEVTVKETA